MKRPSLSIGIAFTLASILMARPGLCEDAHRWSKNPGWAEDSNPEARQPEHPKKHEAPEAYESRRGYTPFSPGSNNLSIDVGQTFLFGDLGDSYSDAIGFQLHDVYAASDMFGLDVSLAYSSHSPGATDGTFTMSNLKFGLRSNLAWIDKAIPYVTGGLGFFRPGYTLAGGTTLDAVLFGLYFGAGVNLEVSKSLFFGGSLSFHDMFGTRKRDSGGTVRDVDGSFASFLVSAGVSF